MTAAISWNLTPDARKCFRATHFVGLQAGAVEKMEERRPTYEDLCDPNVLMDAAKKCMKGVMRLVQTAHEPPKQKSKPPGGGSLEKRGNLWVVQCAQWDLNPCQHDFLVNQSF